MRAVIQRVSRASVSVDGTLKGEIGHGLLVLLAAAHEDTASRIKWMAEKIVGLRIFPDDQGKMNLSLQQVEGQMLIVSQFTLYGDCRKGKRPSFAGSARPDDAEKLYEQFVEAVRLHGVPVQTGVFGAMMDVELVNDGPVTLIIDSP